MLRNVDARRVGTGRNMRLRAGVCLLLSWVSGAWLLQAGSTWYVDASRPDDNGPGTSLTNAWQVIQTAIDNAGAGDLVLVAAGLYDKGGHLKTNVAYSATYSNRVDINKALTLRAISPNAADTIIKGAPDPVTGGQGTNAIRCVLIADGGVLSGFTITNGYDRGFWPVGWGSGIAMSSANTVVSNCVVVGNGPIGAVGPIGNATGGTVYDSIIRDNFTRGAECRLGGYRLTLVNCELRRNQGGGAEDTALINCIITDNTNSSSQGVGAYNCYVVNCVVSGHKATYGAGATGGTAINTTITRNYAGHSAYGAADSIDLYNCVVWGNYLSAKYNCNNISRCSAQEVKYSCIGLDWTTIPSYQSGAPTNYLAHGVNGITTNDPFFVDAELDFSLIPPYSSALNVGTNTYTEDAISNYPAAAFDCNGIPRIDLRYGLVDMGAYEYPFEPPGGTLIVIL